MNQISSTRIAARLGFAPQTDFAHGAAFGAGGRAGTATAPCPLASPGADGAAAHGAALAHGAAHGAQHGAASPHGVPHGTARDAQFVIYRLEEAGTTLLALPSGGHSTRLRTGGLEMVREAAESYGWTEGRIRPAVPSAARITRMDEALAWIPLIPRDKYVLRRIVGARSLVSPVTERHLFSWRRLGTVVGADHKAVQRWHAQGIDLIVAALARL